MKRTATRDIRGIAVIMLLVGLSLSAWPQMAIAGEPGWMKWADAGVSLLGECDGALGLVGEVAMAGVRHHRSRDARKRAEAASRARDFQLLDAHIAQLEAKEKMKKAQARLKERRRKEALQRARQEAANKQWRKELEAKKAAWRKKQAMIRESREIEAQIRRQKIEQAIRKAIERARRMAAEQARRIAAERARREAARREQERRRIAYEKKRAEEIIVASVRSVEAGKREYLRWKKYLDQFMAQVTKGKIARELNEREKYALEQYMGHVQRAKRVLDARMASAQRNITSASTTFSGLATGSALGLETSSALMNWSNIRCDDGPATYVIHINGEVVNAR